MVVILKQSGVIPYKFKSSELYVLLVSNRSGNRWIIPKGQIGENLSAQESALKEAYEEAGVRGNIHSRSIGKYKTLKRSKSCLIKVYPLKVKKTYDKWDECHFRKRRWFKVKEAIEMVSDSSLKELLKDFNKQFH